MLIARADRGLIAGISDRGDRIDAMENISPNDTRERTLRGERRYRSFSISVKKLIGEDSRKVIRFLLVLRVDDEDAVIVLSRHVHTSGQQQRV